MLPFGSNCPRFRAKKKSREKQDDDAYKKFGFEQPQEQRKVAKVIFCLQCQIAKEVCIGKTPKSDNRAEFGHGRQFVRLFS